MKVYVKIFANPLLALAFKEGIDFVGDPDYKAMEPKQEGKMWEVLIEHNDGEDDEDIELIHSASKSTPVIKFDNLNLKDWIEKQSKNMKRVDAHSAPENVDDIRGCEVQKDVALQVFNTSIIHLPVKKTDKPEQLPAEIILDSTIQACGECLNCAMGSSQDCIKIINAACLAVAPRR